MPSLDAKKFMQLNQYHNLLYKRLKSIIEEKELEEYFFWLIKHYCKIDRLNYALNPSRRILSDDLDKLIHAIDKLEKKMPIQYVIGQTEFMSLKFHLNSYVLIPRPETEELVSWVLESKIENKSVLDIGTGSGCIAISLSKYGNPFKVSGWDIKKKIIKIANSNAVKNNVKIDFSINDINNLKTKLKFDVIVSNPPYICDYEKKYMDSNVLNYEPHDSLFVNSDDPIHNYRKIIEFAKKKLNPNGLIFFEINEKFGKNISILLKEKGFRDIQLRKDFRKKTRMVKGIIK